MKEGERFMKPMLTAVFFALLMASPANALTPENHTSVQQPTAYVYRELNGRALKLYVFTPEVKKTDTPVAAMLLFHGGGWVAGDAEWTFPAARRFAALGMVTVAVEYRLSTDTVTPIDALDDTRAAFRWIRQHSKELNIDPHRVAGYGVSAGGQLVAAAATIKCPGDKLNDTNSAPDLLLLWSPALDVENDGWFRRLLRGKSGASDFSPAAQAGAGTPPTCIVHGDKDTLTPLSGTRKFCDRVTQAGGICELNVYKGVGHLLTRNLKNQEDDFDPDPVKREDGVLRLEQFLRKRGYFPAN
jgi:acetyl esterase